MIGENRKLAISGIAGILVASLIITSIAMTPYQPTTHLQEKGFLRATVGFTDFSTINLTIIEEYGGEVIDTRFTQIPAVIAKIPGENITKLAEEEIIEYISYAGRTLLYGEKEPMWNVMAEATYEQLKLTMYLEKTVFQLGEDVKVKFTLTNISEQNVTVRTGGKKFDFIIYNSTNNEIHRWSSRLFFTTSHGTIILKPGENITDVPYKWEQICDIFNANVKYDFLPAPPGSYYIVGEALFDYGAAQIQTSPIEITILQT